MSSDPAPNPHATAEEVEAARHDAKLANVLYHDWEAGSYDDKWSISYDERCISYAADRFRLIAGETGWPYGRALELGSGTGFFLLNLMQAGVASSGSVTDLSPGMVAAALRNAEHLGLDVDGRVADAERIPYDDDTFDLVVGHAVLHHIPDVELALREVLRVLTPGGRFVFAGEPTRIGDAYARRLGALTWKAATTLTKLPVLSGWRRPQAELDESSRAAALEAVVDIHTFDPATLQDTARRAGAMEVRVLTEEFTAAAVPPGKLGMRWAMFAFRSWQRLSWVDAHLASRIVPRAWFYNALVTGTKGGPHR
jgi:SAM-dependent methyltransferase